MNEVFQSILLLISLKLGVVTSPIDIDNIWHSKSGWIESDGKYVYSASSIKLAELCSKEPDSYIKFPLVIHGVHRLTSNNILIYSSGDNSFNKSTPFFFSGWIECSKVIPYKDLNWEVHSYSKYFARTDSFPKITKNIGFFNFFELLINILVSGGLLIISLVTYYTFKNKTNKQALGSLSFGSILWSVYFSMIVSPLFGLNLSMLNSHKIADTALWIGAIFYFNFFKATGLISKIPYYLFTTIVVISSLIILFSSHGDSIQFGTILPMPITFVCFISILYRSFKERKSSSLFQKFSVISFVLTASNDILSIFGVIDSVMILPFGAISGIFFLAAAVNQEIENTYKERDSLLHSLEEKVSEKTKSLSETLETLKKSQGELVQSARLASLGTLSAGIAHEINNSINYVNGALVPLERKVMKSIPDQDRPVVEKLFNAIKEGTHLTVEIVRSLRNYTGLNQAPLKEVNLVEVVNSVTTILRSKLKNIKVVVDIPKEMSFFAHQVGVNQIFMNIISNAIDVVPDADGEIKISAIDLGNKLNIIISDNGPGMSEEVKNRIFDPFFTTKDVGKGTGLGLHIVKNEIDRHKGQIKVESTLGHGASFIITLPKDINQQFNTLSEAA